MEAEVFNQEFGNLALNCKIVAVIISREPPQPSQKNCFVLHKLISMTSTHFLLIRTIFQPLGVMEVCRFERACVRVRVWVGVGACVFVGVLYVCVCVFVCASACVGVCASAREGKREEQRHSLCLCVCLRLCEFLCGIKP